MSAGGEIETFQTAILKFKAERGASGVTRDAPRGRVHEEGEVVAGSDGGVGVAVAGEELQRGRELGVRVELEAFRLFGVGENDDAIAGDGVGGFTRDVAAGDVEVARVDRETFAEG